MSPLGNLTATQLAHCPQCGRRNHVASWSAEGRSRRFPRSTAPPRRSSNPCRKPLNRGAQTGSKDSLLQLRFCYKHTKTDHFARCRSSPTSLSSSTQPARPWRCPRCVFHSGGPPDRLCHRLPTTRAPREQRNLSPSPRRAAIPLHIHFGSNKGGRRAERAPKPAPERGFCVLLQTAPPVLSRTALSVTKTNNLDKR